MKTLADKNNPAKDMLVDAGIIIGNVISSIENEDNPVALRNALECINEGLRSGGSHMKIEDLVFTGYRIIAVMSAKLTSEGDGFINVKYDIHAPHSVALACFGQLAGATVQTLLTQGFDDNEAMDAMADAWAEAMEQGIENQDYPVC